MRPDFPGKFMSEVKKSTDPCKTETVGIWRYPVFYLTPSELGDLEPPKKVFFCHIFSKINGTIVIFVFLCMRFFF